MTVEAVREAASDIAEVSVSEMDYDKLITRMRNSSYVMQIPGVAADGADAIEQLRARVAELEFDLGVAQDTRDCVAQYLEAAEARVAELIEERNHLRDTVHEYADALSRQPMSAAPRDGTELLAIGPEGWDIVRWVEATDDEPTQPGHAAGWLGHMAHPRPNVDLPIETFQPTGWWPLPDASEDA